MTRLKIISGKSLTQKRNEDENDVTVVKPEINHRRKIDKSTKYENYY